MMVDGLTVSKHRYKRVEAPRATPEPVHERLCARQPRCWTKLEATIRLTNTFVGRMPQPIEQRQRLGLSLLVPIVLWRLYQQKESAGLPEVEKVLFKCPSPAPELEVDAATSPSG